MKRNIKILLIAVLILSVLAAGYFLLLDWNPNGGKGADDTTLTTATQYLYDVNLEDIAYIEFNNEWGNYTIYNDDTPRIKGYSSHIIDPDKLSTVFYSCSNASIMHKIDNPSELSDYGLDSAKRSVSVSLTDGTKYKLLIGGSANFEGEYYVMLEGADYVCTISSYKVESLTQNPDSFRNLEVCALDGTSVESFAISKKGEKEIAVQYDEETALDELSSAPYIVTYPYNGVRASADKLRPMFESFGTITATSIVEENPENLEKYGLDNPYILTVKDVNGEVTLKMGSYAEDGAVYVMRDALPVVYMANCPFYELVKDANADEYVERFVNLFSIDAVKKITVRDKKESHTMEIAENSYKIDGKTADEEKFKKIYQQIIGITAAEFSNSRPRGEEKCSITFSFNDGTEKTFTYYIYDERQAIVKGDNSMVCLVLTDSLDAMLNAFD